MSEMKLKPITTLYIISTLAFMFALLKYFYVNISIPIDFLILEILSFVGFIGIIYLSDKIIRKNRRQIDLKDIEFQKKEEEYIQSIEHYKEVLSKFQSENNEEKSEDEIEMISKEVVELASESDDIKKFATDFLAKLAKHYEIGLGVCYFKIKPSDNFSVQGVYGLSDEEVLSEINEHSGVNGESITSQKVIVVNEIDDEYFNIESCTGSSKPKHLYLLPIVVNNATVGIIELATFKMINIENHWVKISNGISEIKVL